MTRAATCVRSLQRFLDLSLTAETISERLLARPPSMLALDLRSELERRSFDVAGIQDDGSERVHRYVRIEALTADTCGDCAETVCLEEVVAKSTPLRDCLDSVVEHERVFVLGRSGIEEIITRADLEKQPVRLLLFGVVSALEMAMLDLIRQRFPDEGWEQYLTEGRLGEAQKILKGRMDRNEQIDLADCLQICDKVTVLLSAEGVLEAWGFSSKNKARTFFDRIQRLRDKLAHAHDPASGSSWNDVVALLERAESVLESTIELTEENQPNASPAIDEESEAG